MPKNTTINLQYMQHKMSDKKVSVCVQKEKIRTFCYRVLSR